MPEPEPTVIVVDDDKAVQQSLQALFEALGFQVETYGAAHELLAYTSLDRPGCLLLDLCLPGTDGLTLQEQLSAQKIPLPIIILTGYGDVPAAVRALKNGALDFIEKPPDAEVLCKTVQRALNQDAEHRRQKAKRRESTHRLRRLTSREQEVMGRIVAGQANKVIAIELGISERTVELHRTRLLRKLEVHSLAELIEIAQLASLRDE